ncbi:ABC transporter substrate-binding protein [Actibacterium sp. 188UL27-1]|uniref:ABC transporter substrate-binding protein n=1 Tax=Actibacterium sp. 188UL27-1 TaxID=2786961 RepID=UPI001956FFBF|nr:extracellular solute-binding protein [Actibacterium sp. 188UL27-1]MBM7068683.1 extracellular solute-binding protein [Actibacterium sp. 188UL27-1]
MRSSDKKFHAANIVDKYVKGKISRRNFLRSTGQLGLALGAFGAGMNMGPRGLIGGNRALAQGLEPDAEMLAWVKEVSKPFAGQTIRLATEATPPSNALNNTLKKYFEEASGIKVEIEILPLEQVLQKMTLDIASQLGTYDLYYIDQSWAAFVSEDVHDPREQMENADLAMPGYDMDDFLEPLVDGIARYGDRLVGVPYDIPIFIMMYRKDIYEEMGFTAPTTLEEYYEQAKAITDAKGPEMYGATGQMKSGHYSLECDWTAWLWGHGGSIFNADGKFTGNDERGLEAMAYWRKLYETMPPGVTGWTWDGQGQSVAQGVAATMMSWGEFFPYFDDPDATKVSGLIEAAPCPAPTRALRTVEETGFGEIPGVGHQGGSSLAVSKNAKNPDAAWIFMQWATSKDTQTLITTLGGGTGPTRFSVYDDPRVIANNRVGAGTTRHLQVVRDTIANDMGSEPDLPQWAELANDTIPVRLGRYFADEYGSTKEAMDDIAQATDAIVQG